MNSATRAVTDAGEPQIDADLVRRLLVRQFPQWAHLPIKGVAVQGNDNRTYRLGDELLVRLPSSSGYASQVAKEQKWLPYLRSHLSLLIPEPIAVGRPDDQYPLVWSVYRWIQGDAASTMDRLRLAHDLAAFLHELRDVPTAGGPPAGLHSWFRGGPLSHYRSDIDRALNPLSADLAQRAEAVFDSALASVSSDPPTWFHGDVAVDNLLVREGRLVAVIDFGCCGVGDPACDLVPAWTMFAGPSREAFREGIDLDAGAWARGRGWALWKALITVSNPSPELSASARQTVHAVLAT